MVGGAGPAGVIDAVIGDAAAAAGGQIDSGDVPGLLAELDTVFDDSHPDPTRRYTTAFYQGSLATEPDLVGQLDEDGRITYGLKANELAFRDIVQGLHMLAAVRYGDAAMTEAAYRDYATAAAERLQPGPGAAGRSGGADRAEPGARGGQPGAPGGGQGSLQSSDRRAGAARPL